MCIKYVIRWKCKAVLDKYFGTVNECNLERFWDEAKYHIGNDL